jgi:dTDP-6-deoxy-L-talose 4-dehydrogenase [NAD(P)+]
MGVVAAARAGTADAVVLRLANVAGPGTPPVSLLGRVAVQLAQADAVDPRVELNSLDAQRDYVDVRDAADAIVAAFEAPVTGRVIDIGRGDAVSVRWLVRELIRVSGVPARLVENRSGEPAADWVRVDPEPAARLLSWRPHHDLTSTLRALWAEYQA